VLSGGYNDAYLLAEKLFELEIIGSFSQKLEGEPYGFEMLNHLRFLNEFYVPNLLIESTFPLYIEAFSEVNPQLVEL
jgi:hypothetical protein